MVYDKLFCKNTLFTGRNESLVKLSRKDKLFKKKSPHSKD